MLSPVSDYIKLWDALGDVTGGGGGGGEASREAVHDMRHRAGTDLRQHLEGPLHAWLNDSSSRINE